MTPVITPKIDNMLLKFKHKHLAPAGKTEIENSEINKVCCGYLMFSLIYLIVWVGGHFLCSMIGGD